MCKLCVCVCVCQTAVSELLYCKIGVFMASASDNTDHLLKRSGRDVKTEGEERRVTRVKEWGGGGRGEEA